MNSASASESSSDPPIGSDRKGVLTKVLFMNMRIMDSEYLICIHDNNSYSCMWDMY